jgi:serine/threonine-protein kinase HipA
LTLSCKFNYLVGNEDMHLKNYSVIIRNGKTELSPAYDFLNSSFVLHGEIEEIALPIKGKKSKLYRELLVNYFGKEQCGLTDKVIEKTLSSFQQVFPMWFEQIENSFLSDEMKEKFINMVQNRIQSVYKSSTSIPVKIFLDARFNRCIFKLVKCC